MTDELNDLRCRVVAQAMEISRLKTENAMLERDNANLDRHNAQSRCRHCDNCKPDRIFIRCTDWGKATSPDGWCYKFRPRESKSP